MTAYRDGVGPSPKGRGGGARPHPPLNPTLGIKTCGGHVTPACIFANADDVGSHQLVLDTMPVLLNLFTRRRQDVLQSPAFTAQLLRTLSLVCHRNRAAQVAGSYSSR